MYLSFESTIFKSYPSYNFSRFCWRRSCSYFVFPSFKLSSLEKGGNESVVIWNLHQKGRAGCQLFEWQFNSHRFITCIANTHMHTHLCTNTYCSHAETHRNWVLTNIRHCAWCFPNLMRHKGVKDAWYTSEAGVSGGGKGTTGPGVCL